MQSIIPALGARFTGDIEAFKDKRVRAQPRLGISFACTGHIRIKESDGVEPAMMVLEMPLQNPEPNRTFEIFPFPESQLWRLKESSDPGYDFFLRGAICGREGELKCYT